MILLSVLAIPLLGILIFIALQKPSNDRDWAPEVALHPSIEQRGNEIHIRHIRRFRYPDPDTIVEGHDDQTIALSDIRGVDLFVEPFSPVRGPAHSLISFNCADGRHIAISVEVRRQNKQREASFWLSIFRQYGLFYVVADEEDVVYLRSHIRRDQVYLHPLRLTPEQAQELFLHTLPRIDTLRETPELYSIFSNTCSTNIRDHLNAVLDRPIPFHWSLLLPAFLPEFLYRHGLIDTDLPFEAHQRLALINTKPELYPDLPFSEAIRQGQKKSPETSRWMLKG